MIAVRLKWLCKDKNLELSLNNFLWCLILKESS